MACRNVVEAMLSVYASALSKADAALWQLRRWPRQQGQRRGSQRTFYISLGSSVWKLAVPEELCIAGDGPSEEHQRDVHGGYNNEGYRQLAR